MKRLGRLIVALLRELADENAYQRHLEQHGRVHSVRSGGDLPIIGYARST